MTFSASVANAYTADSRSTLAPPVGSDRAAPLHIVTPLLQTRVGDLQVGLKLDNLQPARSFKLRGIGLLCQHHAARGVRRKLTNIFPRYFPM